MFLGPLDLSAENLVLAKFAAQHRDIDIRFFHKAGLGSIPRISTATIVVVK